MFRLLVFRAGILRCFLSPVVESSPGTSTCTDTGSWMDRDRRFGPGVRCRGSPRLSFHRTETVLGQFPTRTPDEGDGLVLLRWSLNRSLNLGLGLKGCSKSIYFWQRIKR